MKWYEPLIWEEFIEYFSNPATLYFKVVDGKRICDEMFQNYYYVANGLTYGHNIRDFKCDRNVVKKADIPEYMYRAYIHFLDSGTDIVFQEIWETRFCSFLHNIEIDMKELTTEQLAVAILYPFWERWGSNFIDNTDPRSGRLAEAVLRLYEKHNEENN